MTNSKRFHMPRNWRVRYDYHDKPRGISAIMLDPIGRVRSVGFAKFNPHDASFNEATGRSIALGRALAKLPRHLTRQEDLADTVDRVLAKQRARFAGPRVDRVDLSRSLADELF